MDATKSYAENLIKIFFNYFFKILITIFVCFFSLGMFLEIILIAFTTERESFFIVLFLVTLAIGTMFCSKIPNILSTLLSGNPSMGFGNVMETARGAAHGMHMAQHAVQSAGKITGGLGKGVQGLTRFGMGVGATLDSMASAYNSATGKMKDYNNERVADPETGMMPAEFTGGQMKRAGVFAALSAAGNSMKQSVGDSLYKGLTGQEKKRDTTDGGTFKFGQTFSENGQGSNKADFGDMKKQAESKGQSIGGSRGDSIVENKKQKDAELKKMLEEEARRAKHLPSNDQDAWWNK